MKRYLLKIPALALLFIAVSCQKDPQVDGSSARGMAEVNVSLDGISINESSRATVVVSDITSLATQGFTIAGYHTIDGDGTFKNNLEKVKPNLFNHTGDGTSDFGDAVLDLKQSKEDGKFHVLLSKWRLNISSFLSYTAWSANVAKSSLDYPIKAATDNSTGVGLHFIDVESGKNIDVVAAKSINNKNNVVRGAIDLNFKHVLSKLKFNIVNATGVMVNITDAITLSTQISCRGRYSFTGNDNEVGTWGALQATSPETITIPSGTIPSITSGSTVALHELLVIPQKLTKGAIYITLTYSIKTNMTVINYKRTVLLEAQELVENTSYTYDLIIEENQIKLNEGRIGSWTVIENSSLPIIAGPRDGVTLLLLDAYDAPYAIGNKRYWLDRSGYNNHCELTTTGVTYDLADRSYHFNGNGDTYGILPPNAFEEIKQMSVETIAKRDKITNGAGQSIFSFTTTVSGKEARTMFMHFGYKGDHHLYFDASGGMMPLDAEGNTQYARIDDIFPSEEWLPTYAMYSFFKSETLQVMNRNLGYTHSKTNPSSIMVGTSTNNKIGHLFSGNIKYLKVKVYSTSGVSYITRADYDRLSKRHRIPADDYIKNGLLLDLRGGDALVGGSWKNRAVSGKYDAIQKGIITYNAEQKYYQIRDVNNGLTNTLTGNDYFEIPEGMPGVNLETHTIELVLKSHSGAHDCLMILTSNDSKRGIYYSSYYSDAKIRYQAPTNVISGSNMMLTVDNNPASNNPFGTTEIRSHVLKRVQTANTVMSVYANGTDQPFATQEFQGATKVGAINNIQIGRGGVWISAIRIYNRELNNKERVNNYFVDKALYNIP